MVSVLEDSTAAAANKQLQDMLNNAITDPDKFRNLSITVKAPHVGKRVDEVNIAQYLSQKSFYNVQKENVPSLR